MKVKSVDINSIDLSKVNKNEFYLIDFEDQTIFDICELTVEQIKGSVLDYGGVIVRVK